MAAQLSFETTILQSGKNTTGIQVPEAVVNNLASGKKPAVKVTVNSFTYRSSIAVMGGAFMISVSAEVREKAGIKGGDKVKVVLELDKEPREVVLPADFNKLLSANAKAKHFFESLSYSAKQRYVLPIQQAKGEDTRNRRIEKAISDLEAGKK